MKKLLLIFFTFHFSLFTCCAQGTWTPRDTLPSDSNVMQQGIPGFSIGNYGYAGLGGYNLNDFWQFDPTTNSWSQKANFPGQARVAPACFVICSKAYLVCGSVMNNGTCVNECWEYDATNNTWTRKADFPGPARVYAVGFAIDSLGYVGTGAYELHDFRKDFYAYHPSTDTWTRVADFGGIARSCASGFAVNGKGYVCFGQDSLFGGHWLNNDLWQYDPITNTWTQKSSLPGLPYYVTSGFSICNNIYVGSGIDSAHGATHDFWKYNTLTDTWSQVASIPGITKLQGAAFTIGDTGYYGFGIDSAIRYVKNIFDKFFIGDTCDNFVNCDFVTSIPAINSIYNIDVSPNPFNKSCVIKLPYHINSENISLYNIEGIKVEMRLLSDYPDYILRRDELPDGVYILSVKTGERNYYKKLIITE